MSDYFDNDYWSESYFTVAYWQGNIPSQTLSATLSGSSEFSASGNLKARNNKFWVLVPTLTPQKRYVNLSATIEIPESKFSARLSGTKRTSASLSGKRQRVKASYSFVEYPTSFNNTFWLLAA